MARNKAFEFVPGPDAKDYNPFPAEGDSMWFGDNLGKVVCSETVDEDTAELKSKYPGYSRYVEIKVVIGID